MATIWTFGDSYTAPFAPDPNLNDWRNKYCDWKGYVPKVYGDVMSETLGMPLKNMGEGGTDNRTILDSIINSLGTIKDDDIIIIGWSSVLRFRLVNTSNKFQAVLPSIPRKIYKNLGFDVRPSTLEDILLNRSHINYVKEHNKIIKMIRFLFKNNSSRVVVSGLSYDIPMMYEKGYILYRLRAVGKRIANGVVVESQTNWTANDGVYSNVASFPAANKFLFDGHEQNLNWQSSLSFAEEGKHKAVLINYPSQDQLIPLFNE